MLLVFVLLVTLAFDVRGYLTEAESSHIGQKFEDPDIVKDFKKHPKYSASPMLQVNNLILHHQLVESYCVDLLHRRHNYTCSWREYYYLLNELRRPYANLYDPGLDREGLKIDDVLFSDDLPPAAASASSNSQGGAKITKNKKKKGERSRKSAEGTQGPRKCIEFDARDSSSLGGSMTAERFMSFVRTSTPFIIRNYASEWAPVRGGSSKSSRKKHAAKGSSKNGVGEAPREGDRWTLDYLALQNGGKPVSVGASR